jgi:hypothetical protein
MNHTCGWKNGWTGGGMWSWSVILFRLVVLLVVAISKLLKEYSRVYSSTAEGVQNAHSTQ